MPDARAPCRCSCTELRSRIQQITDGEYAAAKRDVDALRVELGQQPLPSLQATLEEKSQQYVHSSLPRFLPPTPRLYYFNRLRNGIPRLTRAVPGIRYLNERRLSGEPGQKRAAEELLLGGESAGQAAPSKRPRGRPKGSKNRKVSDGAKEASVSAGPDAGET